MNIWELQYCYMLDFLLPDLTIYLLPVHHLAQMCRKLGKYFGMFANTKISKVKVKIPIFFDKAELNKNIGDKENVVTIWKKFISLTIRIKIEMWINKRLTFLNKTVVKYCIILTEKRVLGLIFFSRNTFIRHIAQKLIIFGMRLNMPKISALRHWLTLWHIAQAWYRVSDK